MKPFALDIADHVRDWRQRLPPQRRWWPQFVYHFTDVNNAVSILRAGTLLSRQEAIARGYMSSDNAAGAIVGSTDERVKSYARLYFRPRTPTQYRNEGIRPRGERWEGAHCPVPVFFLFGATQVLGHDDALYSNGNLARASARTGNDLAFFKSIDFADVFSDGPMPESRKDEMIFRRQAEILVPQLPLAEHLRSMFVRSVAERQTFLELMGPELRKKWEPYVFVENIPLFERRATFIDSVSTYDDAVTLNMSPSTSCPGPFDVEVEYRTPTRTRKGRFKADRLNRPWRVRIPGTKGTSGTLTIHLDDALAFTGPISFSDSPF